MRAYNHEMIQIAQTEEVLVLNRIKSRKGYRFQAALMS
jgi:hypothetical protein